MNGGTVIVFETIFVGVFVSVVEAVEVTALVILMMLVTLTTLGTTGVKVKVKVVMGTLGLFMPDPVTIEVETTVTFRTDVHQGL